MRAVSGEYFKLLRKRHSTAAVSRPRRPLMGSGLMRSRQLFGKPLCRSGEETMRASALVVGARGIAVRAWSRHTQRQMIQLRLNLCDAR